MSNTVSDPMIPTLPETLLAPLLDTAGDLLKGLEADELPLALRPLAGFDRRGLARGAARQQLLRAMETDVSFRDRAIERFLERPEVVTAIDSWDPAASVERVAAAAERQDLPLLASALFAARPPGWAFGLGVIFGAYAQSRRTKEEDDDIKALQTRLAAVDEARRRADEARALADDDAERLERELRDERRSRRARESGAEREAETAGRKADELERALATAQAAADAADERVRRVSERGRAADAELRSARAELAEAEHALAEATAALDRAPAPGTGLRKADLQALADAAALARRLADGLGGVVEQARRIGRPAAPKGTPASAPAASRPVEQRAARGRRSEVPVPPGLVAEAPAAVDAMLRTPQLLVVVDGYNVSMKAWPEASAAEQRDRLVALFAELHLRVRCAITLVFDGADVGPVRPVRRPGVRVVFSDPDEEADAVVVREVAALPLHAPALVVSSDGWVREHAEAEGARVVGAEALLRALRA